ncbi:DNA (cytosine-5-)-methyltransferase [bacterium]|nr:DNA (cytosine-5-)-methyltransferase [bacterium]
MANKKLTVGGLFSGVGGIELAFERAGFEINWSNEIDKNACKTYRYNHPHHNLIEDDIYQINPKELKPVDVLVGGFPCQAFSVAGYQKGFRDPRGNLFFEIVRLIEGLKTKPKALMLENVKNLSGHDSGKTKDIIIKTLREFGYSVFWEVYNTSVYTNIPQNRERTIIVCFRDEKDWEFDLNNQKKYSSYYFDQNHIKPSKNKKSIQQILEKKEVDEKFYYRQDFYAYKELRKTIKRKDTVYQWRRVYVRENKSNECPTLTANMGTGGHNVPLILDDFGIRKLTPRECFRLQGFKNIKFPKDVARSQLYKQAGNSVTVDLIERIAKLMSLSINKNL